VRCFARNLAIAGLLQTLRRDRSKESMLPNSGLERSASLFLLPPWGRPFAEILDNGTLATTPTDRFLLLSASRPFSMRSPSCGGAYSGARISWGTMVRRAVSQNSRLLEVGLKEDQTPWNEMSNCFLKEQADGARRHGKFDSPSHNKRGSIQC
jgi:hypothetical protein